MADTPSSISPSSQAQSVHPTTEREKERRSGQPRIRRRNRLITSCLECRRRKLKCDRLQPCTTCTRLMRDCVYLAPAMDPVGKAKLAEVKEKMGLLERTLEEDVAKRQGSRESSGSAGAPEDSKEFSSDEDIPEDEKDLEPSSLLTLDAAYYEDVDDDSVDLGVKFGRMRITDRLGGWVRPKFSEELAQGIKETTTDTGEEIHGYINFHAGETAQDYFAPGPDYVPPSSGFVLSPKPKNSILEFLPTKEMTDKLLEQYWKAVHVIARAVHRPSFEREYELFWNEVAVGIEPRVSFQAVVMAALLSAAISMPAERVLSTFGVSRDSLIDNFKHGTETTLSRANFLRTTKLETIQAFVMYLIPLCRSEISRAHSALVGTLIRLAECMGLHRDPSIYSFTPVEVHIRRIIWHQICFLDVRTSEATGPRPQIRSDDFDTQFPKNIDDSILEEATSSVFAPDERAEHFTDMTISLLRFECNEMHRFIWESRPKLHQKKMTLTALLSKIKAFQERIKSYIPMLDRRVPLHFLATQVYGILSRRMYVMTLSSYASNMQRLMPDRLREILLSSCIHILELSITIHETPALAIWHWYMGALHQYNAAIQLLPELQAKPTDPSLESRAWRCLDFAFELPAEADRLEKARYIMSELSRRTGEYASKRRLRTPSDMPAAEPRSLTFAYQAREQERQEREKSSSAEREIEARALDMASNPLWSSTIEINKDGIVHSFFPLGKDQQLDNIPAIRIGVDTSNHGAMAGVPSTTNIGLPPSTGVGIPTAPPNHLQYSGMPYDSAQRHVPNSVPASGGRNQHTSGGLSMPGINVSGAGPTLGHGIWNGHNSNSHGHGGGNVHPGDPIVMGNMPDVDWNEWDRLFPPTTVPQGEDQLMTDHLFASPFENLDFSASDLVWES